MAFVNLHSAAAANVNNASSIQAGYIRNKVSDHASVSTWHATNISIHFTANVSVSMQQQVDDDEGMS